MSESQPHPENEGNIMVIADLNPKAQLNIIESHPSFTQLKKSDQNPVGEGDEIKHFQQFINRPGPSSRDDLISIAETFNGQGAQFRSADTLFTEQQQDALKIEQGEQQQIKVEKSQGSSNKESIKIESNEQPTDHINPPINNIPLTQTAPFQVLQDKNTQQIQSTNIQDRNTESIFTLTHTQQIKIDNKEYTNTQEKQAFSEEAVVSELDQRKSRFKITKTIEQNHIPNKEINKQQITQKTGQMLSQGVKQEIKTQLSQVKEQAAQKAEPFKLQSLYVSTLRSNTAIKPPQSASEKKPKIWQMFKNKRQNKQAESTKSSLQPPKQSLIIKTDPLNISQISPIALTAQTVTNTNKDQIKSQVPINETIEQQPVQTSKKPQVEEQKKIMALSSLQSPKLEQRKQQKPLFNDGIDQSGIVQFHRSKHHPLEHINLEQTKQANRLQPLVQASNSLQQQDKPSESIVNNIEPSQQQQQAKAQNDQNIQKQKQQQMQFKEQSSEASPSQKQQMIVDYTHNKKYQEQLQKINRQKIKQLELKLRNQEEINRQLQKSVSLPIKFIASAAVGASTAGIAWIARKNKNVSILLGIATTLATFVFSY